MQRNNKIESQKQKALALFLLKLFEKNEEKKKSGLRDRISSL